MTGEEIRLEQARIVARYGNWTNHNIHLGSDIFTMGKDVSTGAEAKLTRILQMVVDVAGGSLEQLRVLDLACLEGLYGLAFALHGAEVVGIEGREPNIEKARFAQRALGLENIRFFTMTSGVSVRLSMARVTWFCAWGFFTTWINVTFRIS